MPSIEGIVALGHIVIRDETLMTGGRGGSGKSGKKKLPPSPLGTKNSTATCMGIKTQLNNLEEKKIDQQVG